MRGETISEEELAAIQTEDDHGEIIVNGDVIAVEMATRVGDFKPSAGTMPNTSGVIRSNC